MNLDVWNMSAFSENWILGCWAFFSPVLCQCLTMFCLPSFLARIVKNCFWSRSVRSGWAPRSLVPLLLFGCHACAAWYMRKAQLSGELPTVLLVTLTPLNLSCLLCFIKPPCSSGCLSHAGPENACGRKPWLQGSSALLPLSHLQLCAVCLS